MTRYDDLETWVRSENEDDDSVNDQVVVAKWFMDRSITVVDERVARTSQVEDRIEHRIDYQVRTCLDNLEEIDVIVQFDPPGSGRYIRHHRSGENYYDPGARGFVPPLEEDISRFLDDLAARSEHAPQLADGGTDNEDVEDPPETLRSVAAEAIGTEEQSVESALSDPSDLFERMNRYDGVVKAIKDSENVSRNCNYDEMGWRNSALRWSLSERATRLEANESLPR